MTSLDAQRSADSEPHRRAQLRADHVERFQKRTESQWAGSVDLVERVSTGIAVKGDVLRLNPELPQEIERLDMRIRYRGHSLDSRLTRAALTVRRRDPEAAPILLSVEGKVCERAGGATRALPLHDEVAKRAILRMESD